MDKSLIIIFIIGAVLFAWPGKGVANESELLIVNGTTAEEGEFPYLVQLIDQFDELLCGGTIIGPEWILTAGTCVTVPIISIVYGTNRLYDSNYTDSYNVIDVKEVFRHPNFEWTVYGFPQYDVGLIQLSEPIPYSYKVQPIQLADDDRTIPIHKQGVFGGWGNNQTGNGPMPYLQKIELQLLTDEECSDKINGLHQSKAFNATHNICSDDYWSGFCLDDYGGPIVINGLQYGIASWRYIPCGIVPGAYTRITNPEYQDFIKNVTNM